MSKMEGLSVSEPTVSVIIPAFNAASTIAKSVLCCLRQTLTSLEVLVVDDASTDATVQAVEQAAAGDSRVMVERSPSNKGPAAARNRAIALARGRWIALLDADDCFTPERLAVMVERAERLGADLLADNVEISYPEAEREATLQFSTSWMSKPDPIKAAELAAQDRPYHGRASAGFSKPLLRREFLERTGIRYNTDLRIGEDFHLYLQCLLKGARFFRMPEAFYLYRYEPQSLSRGAESKKPEQLLRGNQDLLAIAEAAGDEQCVRELRRRGVQLAHWIDYLQLKQALQSKSLSESLLFLTSTSSRWFAFQLLMRATLRRLLPAVS